MARKLSKLDQRKFQAYCRGFRKHYAEKYQFRFPVKVRVVKPSFITKHWGEKAEDGFDLMPGRFYGIYISNETNYTMRVSALEHEWSHVLDAHLNGIKIVRRDPHNPERWGPLSAETHNLCGELGDQIHQQFYGMEERNG